MSFLGVGASEAMLVVIIALIVIGPNRFPEAMRTAGRWYRMARAYSNEVMKDVRAAVDDIEREVNTEAEEFKTVREMTDISGDIREAQRGTAEVLGDTDRALNAPATSATTPTATTPTTSTPAEADTTPRPIRPSQRPAEQPAASTPAAPKKAAPAEQAPSFDPFKQPKGGRRPSRATSSSSSTPRTTPTPATEAADAPDTAGTSSDASGDNPA